MWTLCEQRQEAVLFLFPRKSHLKRQKQKKKNPRIQPCGWLKTS